MKVLKLSDHVKLQNFLFVHNSLNNKLPKPLRNSFTFMAETFSNTRSTIQNKMALPKARTLTYGLHSISYCSAAMWNVIAKDFPLASPHLKSISLCKIQFRKDLIDSYNLS